MEDRAIEADAGSNRSGTPDGGAPPPPSPVLLSTDPEQELARARERLAFYEGFDRLIQENIARSGDLLRQAAAEREAAVREAAAARAELDRQLAAQRERERSLLLALGEELVALQAQAAALGRRVTAALDELAPAPALVFDPPAAQIHATTPTAGLPAEVPPRPPPDVPPSPTATEAPDGAAEPPMSAPSAAGEVAAEEVGAGEEKPTAAPAPDAARGTAPSLEPETVVSEPAADAARPIAVVVHGVPRAAAALALQRHLAGLEQVEAVEAREYAAGVLRLQVTARGALALDDLRRWEGGGGLEPVNVLADVIEVKLPGVAGL